MKSFRVWKVWDGLGCVASLATILNRPAHHACINGYALRLAGVVSLLAFGLPLAGSAAPRQQLRGGHVPAAVARLVPAGSLPSTQRLNLAIGLPLRNRPELDALLQQLYDPASPNYHRYLTPEEFTARFGPTVNDYQALMDFAKSNGLAVTVTHPNRVVLDVAGTVKDIQKAFRLTLRTYRHPREAREFYAPDVEPSVDFAVPILHISGLDNYSLPHPNSRIKPAGASDTIIPNAGSGPSGSYWGSDFQRAYVPGTTNTGVGQSVGLLQFDGFYASDITSYVNQAGLPSVPPLTVVPIDGGVSTPGINNGEVCLDIEMVISMAPSLVRVYVYEAPNPSPWVDLLSQMANDNLAKQLSSSWSGGPPDPSAEAIFQQMIAQGQSFFNASGDNDAYTEAIPFPSDSTNITVVGGTTLTTGTGGAYSSETVWNRGGGQGSSGGISAFYHIPFYQLGISMLSNQGSTTWRNVPDVALTAENVYVVYSNGISGTFGEPFGGTSCAAPLWAGFTALVNQQAAAVGLGPVGFLNSALYTIGKSPNYTTAFHDTITGSNTWAGSPNLFFAVPNYDLCTGWGTPNGTNLINMLLAVGAPQIISQPQSQTVTAGADVKFTVIASGIGPLNYHWSLNGVPISAATDYSYSIARVQSIQAGTYTVVVSNSFGSVLSAPAILSISSASAFGIVGAPFKYQIIANNNPTYYSASGLPPGLSCNGATGLISGTPTQTGTFSVKVQAKNIIGSTASATVVFTIAAGAITSATRVQGVIGVLGSYQILADNSPTWRSATGLPSGLNYVGDTGVISGTPTQTGTFSVNVQARNLYGTASAIITLTFTSGAIISATSVQGVVGAPFNYQIIADNNPTWRSATGLPPGLSCDGASGIISGTPTQTGTFGVNVQARNLFGTASAIITMTIRGGAITSAASAHGVIGVPFSYQIIANNSPTWRSASGLPPGLSCDGASGIISGTPTKTGMFGVNVQARNLFGTASATVTISISGGAIVSATSAQGVIGVPFNYQIVADNSPTWRSASGLPSGLSCNGASGVISGTPIQTGTFSVHVEAKNLFGTASVTISLTISDGTIGGASQPTLGVLRTGSSVLLTWPVTSGGYVLEETQLQPNAWTNSSAPVVVQGSNNVATITTAVSAKFYRLRK